MKNTLQRILVPLDPSPYTEAASHLACEVAKLHHATLQGLVVLDTPEIRARIAPVEIRHWPTVIDAIRAATEDAEEQIDETREKFGAICEQHSIVHQEAEMEGVPADMILEVSGLHDLVVVGLRTHFHFETREHAGDSLSKILGRTCTPVLATPKEKPAALKRVLVCYDGSMAAARTLRDFTLFAGPLDLEITLLTGDVDEGHGDEVLKQAAHYLRAYGKDPVRLHNAPSDVFKTIEEDYIGNVDLIVAGIHNRNVIRDAFVSSLTNELIDREDVALFMSH